MGGGGGMVCGFTRQLGKPCGQSVICGLLIKGTTHIECGHLIKGTTHNDCGILIKGATQIDSIMVQHQDFKLKKLKGPLLFSLLVSIHSTGCPIILVKTINRQGIRDVQTVIDLYYTWNPVGFKK